MNSGKQAQFENLYQEYFAMVRQISLGYMKGNQALAEELSQEVFVNVWRTLDKFDEKSSFKTWIYRITVNTCLKRIRDSKDEQYIRDTEIEKLAVQTNERDNSLLYQAIGKLKELDRLIIMMVLDEADYTQIADVLGTKEGALRVRIHRIKKQLQELIGHEQQ